MNIFKKRTYVFFLVLCAAFSALQNMERQEEANSDSSEDGSDESTNRLTVDADYSEYLQICALLEILNSPRPQVAIEGPDRALTPNATRVMCHFDRQRGLVRLSFGDIGDLSAAAETSPTSGVDHYRQVIRPIMAPQEATKFTPGKKLRDEIIRTYTPHRASMPRVRGLAGRAREIQSGHRRGGHGGFPGRRSLRRTQRDTDALGHRETPINRPQIVRHGTDEPHEAPLFDAILGRDLSLARELRVHNVHNDARAHSRMLDRNEESQPESQNHKDLARIVFGRLDYVWEDEPTVRGRRAPSLEPVQDEESMLRGIAISIARHFIRIHQAASSTRDTAHTSNRPQSSSVVFQGWWACDGISD